MSGAYFPRPFGVDYYLPRDVKAGRRRHTVVMAPSEGTARLHVVTVHPNATITRVARVQS